jgi:hypothetical protein
MVSPVDYPESSLAGAYVFDLFLVGQDDNGAVIIGRIDLNKILLFDRDDTGLQRWLGGEKRTREKEAMLRLIAVAL